MLLNFSKFQNGWLWWGVRERNRERERERERERWGVTYREKETDK